MTANKGLIAAIGVGAALRIIAALYGYGYFAADDIKYAIEPAWAWLESPDTPYPSPIRLPVLSHGLWLAFRGGRALGIESGANLLRFVYLLLGLYSLVAIPATYTLVRRSFPDRPNAALVAAWLVAVSALMPRLSTRALISVVAIPPLTVGLGFASGRRLVDGLLAAVFIGIACVFRFQLGLVYLGVLVALAAQRRHRCLHGALLGGALFFGALAIGAPEVLETLNRYLRFNASESSSFGTAPWYTFVVFFVLLTVPPATIWLARPLWRAARSAPLLSIPLGCFVVVHSLIPHKEERFMFAVLPLFFALLAPALSRVPGLVARGFWAVNLLLVLPVTLSDGNRSVATPLAEVGQREDIQRVVVYGRFVAPTIYVNRKAKIVRAPGTAADVGTRYLFIEGGPEPDLAGRSCSDPRRYEGDLVDRLLLAINPAGNKRRRARIAVDCPGP